MKHKNIITTILAIILVIPLVIAIGNITNVNPLPPLQLDIPSFIAGDTTSTEFSFDYPDDFENNPDASLVIKVYIESLNESYPVRKNDFQLSGLIKQYPLFNLEFLSKSYALKCVEDDEINFRVDKGLLYTQENFGNGTFYCYDPNNYINMLKLDRRDKVFLEISSDPALYPGQYSVSVDLLEMEPDYTGPEIELIEPSGEDIFPGENGIIPIKLNITDMYAIDSETVKYKIVTLGVPSDGEGLNMSYYDSGWIYEIEYNEISRYYEADFNMTEHGLTESGSYWIYAEAKDVLSNEGKL